MRNLLRQTATAIWKEHRRLDIQRDREDKSLAAIDVFVQHLIDSRLPIG
ncbi:hypothetical protein [Myxococcus xanthus]|nr:hypothetical protein [Myxococcus xanthus]NOJ54342.1 hypothetical protein [Myxococcus xanthus]QPM78532.1 hypothetical protein I5Q59_30310 [Myxococcus xanthus]QVW67600.1 hypothetical protein JTM82_35660 [Myxococcus xanthus DZ2]UEO06273.1 hypothetical protein K1515_07130 [Myxococcus xanthus DZ2]UYI13440.1 hypothetical protein N3T43_30940 [Myxococcus xanthus]